MKLLASYEKSLQGYTYLAFNYNGGATNGSNGTAK